jgi:hypothetical protein
MPEIVDQLISVGIANPLFGLGAILGLGLALSALARSR